MAKKEKGTWVSRLKKKVKKYFKKEKSTKKKKEGFKTARTKQIENRLRDSGMSEDMIKRMRGTNKKK